MLPSFFSNENLRLIIFGGKGGTGKTTSAAATALYLAKAFPEKKIMIISTDPAHSLGDSFNCTIGAEKIPIGNFQNLWALEIDPQKTLEDFKSEKKKVINKLLERSGFYGQINLNDFLSFSLPGMDEIMIFLQIANFLTSRKVDLIILDTAPTGHTLRLLSLPKKMEGWINVFETSLKRYCTGARVPFATVKVSRPKPGGDFVDKFVKELKEDLEMVRALFTNSQECEFVPVAIPEPMGIEETKDLFSNLKKLEIPVRNIIINRFRYQGCEFCTSKWKEQKEAVAEIEERFVAYNLLKVPLFPYEVRGEERLIEYAEILSGKTYQPRPRVNSSLTEHSSVSNLPGLLKNDLKFIIFGGKGGVGKTSLAVATSLRVAKLHPDKKVLIYSIDPAHSLADAFALPVGRKVTSIPGMDNLYALETDAAKLHQEFIERIRALIRDAFDLWETHLSFKGELRWDRPVMDSFAQSSPPGLDEALALEQVISFAEKGEYDIFVLDTAPTGHLLILLQFPEVIRDWLRQAYTKLMKWNRELPLTEFRELGNLILNSTVLLRKVRQALTDSQKNEFVAATIPEALGIAETEDLLLSIAKLDIPCRHIVVNQITPPNQCDFCRTKREEELKYIEAIKKGNPLHIITEIPLLSHAIHGIEDLSRLAEIMYRGDNDFSRSNDFIEKDLGDAGFSKV